MKPDAEKLKGSVSASKLTVCGLIAACVMMELALVACPKGSRPPAAVLAEDRDEHGTIAKQPEYRDSAGLGRTSVVATLDCPMPEHKNVIWCSTFQMAWDKLRDDIIGEPVDLSGAEELVGRLNQAEVSPGDAEEESFYAMVGFVRNGIIEQIREEMSQRFPSEPRPVFDKRYTTIGETIVAYGYLNVEVRPKYPFYGNNSPFIFADSHGERTDVTSFRRFFNVEILYHKYDDDQGTDEFAVDLCDDTNQYRMVAARVPRYGTLGQTVAAVEKKISEFTHDPNYAVLRKLRLTESLTVPNVLYELTHHFTELEDKKVKNRQLPNYFIGQAVQTIDFALIRTGLIMKFDPILLPPPPHRFTPKPRHLRLNRPFLIYIKKRADLARPFFVMWVDNAELMRRPDQAARRKHEATYRLYRAITAPDVNEVEVRSAISSGADLNAPWGIELGTALHTAVARGDKGLVELLIASGADLKAKDYRGRTPLDYAIFTRQADIVELLRAAAR